MSSPGREPVGLVVDDDVARPGQAQHRVDAAGEVAAQRWRVDVLEQVGVRRRAGRRAAGAGAAAPATSRRRACSAVGRSPPDSGSSKSSSASRSVGATPARVGPPASGVCSTGSSASARAPGSTCGEAVTDRLAAAPAAARRRGRVPRCRRPRAPRAPACRTPPRRAGRSSSTGARPRLPVPGRQRLGRLVGPLRVLRLAAAADHRAGRSCTAAVSAEYDVRRQAVSRTRWKRAAASGPASVVGRLPT